MNSIELQAFLAMKHVAGLIVYVFDPTLEYPLKDQEKLLKNIKELSKPVVVFLSKTDIADGKTTDELKSSHPGIITDAEELKKVLIEISREQNKTIAKVL